MINCIDDLSKYYVEVADSESFDYYNKKCKEYGATFYNGVGLDDCSYPFVSFDIPTNKNNIFWSSEDKMVECYGRKKLVIKKPRTKTEYVKCEDSIFDLKPDFEAGELYWYYDDGERYIAINQEAFDSESFFAEKWMESNIYRKVEKEIDWDDEAIEFLNKNDDGGDWNVGSRYLSDLKMIKFCRLIESLTRHIEVD